MRRLIVSLTLAGLAAGLLAIPASAATVRVVDNDGKASAGSCGSSTKAFKTIQGAVDASSAGDTVLVCPGTYAEAVEIHDSKDRLTIRGTSHWGATVRIPADAEDRIGIWIKPNANRVTIDNMRVRWVAPLPAPVAGGSACGANAGIEVDGNRARILGNQVIATGPGTLLCGLDVGIQLGLAGDAAETAVRYNVVKDFSQYGILAMFSDTDLHAFRNILRFYHKDAVEQQQQPIRPDRRTAAKRLVRPAGRFDAFGIAALQGVSGTIRENTVEGSLTGRGPLSASNSRYLELGIWVDGGAAVEIRANRVYRAFGDILTGQLLNGTAGVPAVVQILDNVALSGRYGIVALGSGAVIDGNQSRSNVVGLYADEGSVGNVFTGNDARYNYGVDCDDHSSADALTVANTWTDNLASTDLPDGICPPVPQQP